MSKVSFSFLGYVLLLCAFVGLGVSVYAAASPFAIGQVLVLAGVTAALYVASVTSFRLQIRMTHRRDAIYDAQPAVPTEQLARVDRYLHTYRSNAARASAVSLVPEARSTTPTPVDATDVRRDPRWAA